MSGKLFKWCIYEIESDQESINGVMLRGRIRKFGVENGFNVLAENTSDRDNGVRFAVIDEADGESVSDYVKSVIVGCKVHLTAKDVVNPVLSKMKVNNEERYRL